MTAPPCVDGWTRTFPSTNPAGLDATRTFPRLVVQSTLPLGNASKKQSGMVLVQSKKKYRYKPIPRSGQLQKDGFDLSLTQSSFEQFSNLSEFRRQVIVPIRERNRKQQFGGNNHGKKSEKKDLLNHTLEKVRTVAQRMLIDRRQYVGAGLKGFEGTEMSRQQFKDAMRSQFHLKLSKPELDVLFKHFDHDQSGTVDYMEVKASFMNPERLVQAMDSNKGHHGDMFNEAMQKIREAANKGQGGFSLQEVFSMCDVNGDGKVSRDEMKGAMEQLGAQLSNRQVNALYAFLDPNGDGEVDFGEFSWAFYNRRRNKSKQDSHRVTPWRPVTFGAAKESVSRDRVGAYCNSSAPYLDRVRQKEALQSSATEMALHGQTWKSSNTYKVRQSIYGSDYYLHSPVTRGKFVKGKKQGLFLSSGSKKYCWSHTS